MFVLGCLVPILNLADTIIISRLPPSVLLNIRFSWKDHLSYSPSSLDTCQPPIPILIVPFLTVLEPNNTDLSDIEDPMQEQKVFPQCINKTSNVTKRWRRHRQVGLQKGTSREYTHAVVTFNIHIWKLILIKLENIVKFSQVFVARLIGCCSHI
jgi:hypothetical protein